MVVVVAVDPLENPHFYLHAYPPYLTNELPLYLSG